MPDQFAPSPDAIYWKRKLAAFLHDSPEKVLSIVDHEYRARRIAGEIPDDERSRKEADWTASAADRLPLPSSRVARSSLSCFRHPLGKSSIQFNKDALPVGLAEQNSQTTRPSLNENDPRAAFIATWRFWRNWAASRHPDFALYPAETRLPDHTIWNHLAVTSAMQGCLGGEPWKPRGDTGTADQPAFLLFTIGPVQDFILASRSTRDLWSGSYLLSYLIGHALRRIALDFGPDHVIFPNLCDQPLIDLLLRKPLWDHVSTTRQGSLFEAFGYYSDEGRERLLTPALPNRFLAVLPSSMHEHRARGAQFASLKAYAEFLAQEIRDTLKAIAQTVAADAAATLGGRFDRARFDAQLPALLDIHWQTLPWPDSFAGAEALARRLPADTDDYAPRAGLATTLHLAKHGADTGRYLDHDGKPNNIAAAWSAFYAAAEWALDGTKANRTFHAQQGGSSCASKNNAKDSLNARYEAVLMVEGKEDADALSALLKQKLDKGHLLKAGEILAAGTLIKRLWPFAHLCREHSINPGNLNMPNTRSIAAHLPWEDDDGSGEEGEEDRYFAILALDGDSMGKWISGSKNPPLSAVLSDECAKAYLEKGAKLDDHRRPLSPAWHLQFSEALGNFSQYAVRLIVEAFDGRLLYAGGDDVLAMLPSDTALACAEALRLAFRGDPKLNETALGRLERQRDPRRNKNIWRSDRETPLFAIKTPGFLQLTPQASSRHGAEAPLLDDPVNFPVIVPGPATDVSVGLAIAHFKAPLQDVVRAAQAAEKHAKNQLDRAAIAVSLFKRSGEITEWGCKWESGGLALYGAIARHLEGSELSAKFPHRVCALLEPYLNSTDALVDAKDFDATAVIVREFSFAATRQGSSAIVGELSPLLHAYLNALKAAHEEGTEKTRKNGKSTPKRSLSAVQLRAVIGLCTAVAFAHRTRSETIA